MNEKKFIESLKELNIILNEDQILKFRKYYELIVEYNLHTNITSITKKEEVYLKHFYDSALVLTNLEILPGQTMLDIGSGAGLPGVVLKIIYPELNITLLDSNNKKTKFLLEVISALNLKQNNVVNLRAEEYIENNREIFDYVVARAVKELRILSEISLPFVKKNGYFIAMKGKNIEEIDNSNDAIKLLGGEIDKISHFSLIDNSNRMIVYIKKVELTNKIYPRSYSTIVKHPL